MYGQTSDHDAEKGHPDGNPPSGPDCQDETGEPESKKTGKEVAGKRRPPGQGVRHGERRESA
jgi:hypothetical protein